MPLPSSILALLDQAAPIDTAADSAGGAEGFIVPAKPAVYLLVDAEDAPVLLATVGNLRAALQRRLAETPPEQKSKRIAYAQICRRVIYRIVHSPFAANWFYSRAARALFPQSYRSMISWRGVCFVAVQPEDEYPRFRRTDDLTDPQESYFGPIAERRAADQLIQTLEDLFDLCRYYQILVQSPDGKACAYKEMGKCPAPCDGTVPLEHYRGQIREALRFISSVEENAGALTARTGYHAWRRAMENTMASAAAALEFEKAARLKAALARAAILEQPAFAFLDRLERFAYLALQPGQGKPWIEPFFIHGGTIEAGTPVKRKELPQAAALWYERCRQLAVVPVKAPVDTAGVEAMALVTHHLFRGVDDAGVYLPMHTVTDSGAILRAAEGLLDRRTPPKPMAEQSSDANSTAVELSAEPIALSPLTAPPPLPPPPTSPTTDGTVSA